METIFFIALFSIGTAFGSFINVLSLRYHPERGVFARQNIGGRSRCDSCKRTLKWHELIPLLSFFIQRGKCKNCNKKLTFQYPIVELLSGIIVLGVPIFLNNFWGVSQTLFSSLLLSGWYYGLIFLWVLVFLVFLLISLIDLKHFIIPDELNGVIGVCGIIIVAIISSHINDLPQFSTSFVKNYSLLFSPFQNIFINHIMGAIVSSGFFLMLSILTKGRGMGFGDVKLGFVIGLLFGWTDSILIILLSFIIGGLWGLYLVFSKRKKMKDRIPFGPLLILGSLLVFLFGSVILNGYFNLFSL